MVTRRRTLTAGVVILCAALTGCEAADVGSAAPPPASSLAPSGSPETGSPETGSPAASPSAAALPSASASASAAASAAAGNDLASTIPAEVNGIPITISTVEPEAFIGTNDIATGSNRCSPRWGWPRRISRRWLAAVGRARTR